DSGVAPALLAAASRLEAGRAVRRWALLGALSAALASAPPALPSDVTPAELAALAARAPTDPRALAQLRAVDHVDGRAVGLVAALGAGGPALRARLRVLASRAAVGPTAPRGDSRAAAHSILSERRFSGSDVPRPLHRPLHWLGDWVRRAFDWLAGRLPGGDTT